MPQSTENRDWLEHLFQTGVAATQPRATLPAFLPDDAPKGRNIVLGAGKASAEMAAVANEHLLGPTVGVVATRYGHGARSTTGDIRIIEAGHPVPDKNSVAAATDMLELAASAGPNDRVFFLISGGGSALICSPIDGVTLDEKQRVTRHLLHSGANIAEINRVRKHLSNVKGGRLAAATSGAELHTFVISDVVGDDSADVASGPSIGDTSSTQEALDVLERYSLPNRQAITDALRKAKAVIPRPHPVHLIANAGTALNAVAEDVRQKNWQPIIVGDAIEGDATAVGCEHASLAKSHRAENDRIALISGGELTVTIRNKLGRGGPNLEYLTSLMIHLDGAAGIQAIACDSDGVDGSEDNAGGYISETSLARAKDADLNPAEILAANNSYELFSVLGDLVVTGPTLTNVNDIRIVLVDPGASAKTTSSQERADSA